MLCAALAMALLDRMGFRAEQAVERIRHRADPMRNGEVVLATGVPPYWAEASQGQELDG